MKSFTILASFEVKGDTRDDAVRNVQDLIDDAPLDVYYIEAAGADTPDANRAAKLLRELCRAVNFKAACIASDQEVEKIAFADERIWSLVDEALALEG